MATGGISVVLLALVVAFAVAVAWHPGTAAAAGPSVVVKPTLSTYADGQSVAVSVGPNSLFTPHLRIAVIECADPGGTASGLPTSISTCDENTVQPDTVLVQPNGSFSEPDYTLYALPNIALGEQGNWQPVCNQTHKCVLFVGEDQDDFTKPKVFSAPFAFTSTAPTLAGRVTTGATSSPTIPVSASVSLPAATLAFTGTSDATPWLVALGGALVGGGILGRRTMKRRLK